MVDSSFGILDFLIIIPLMWAIYRGFVNGFLIELLTLMILLLLTYAYIRVSEIPAKSVSKPVSDALEYVPLIVFTIIFTVLIYLTHLLQRLGRRITTQINLTVLHRLFGIIFSTWKFLFIISCYLVFIDKVNEKFPVLGKESTDETMLYPIIKKIAPAVFPYLSFDNIKNSEYIDIVENTTLNHNNKLIPVRYRLNQLKGHNGKIRWTSYQSDNYKDNHELVIVKAIVENTDNFKLKTAEFEFLLSKEANEVSLYSYKLNGTFQKIDMGYKVLYEGEFR